MQLSFIGLIAHGIWILNNSSKLFRHECNISLPDKSIFAPLFISGEINATKEPYGFFKCMQDVFLYKSQLFLILLTYGLIIQSMQFLGVNGLIGSLVGVAIAFFGLHLYNQYIPKDSVISSPGLVPTKQFKMKGGNKKMSNK